MARPHGKALEGKEAGKDCHHWHDYLESKKRIKSRREWDGGSPPCPHGVKYVLVLEGGVLSDPVDAR